MADTLEEITRPEQPRIRTYNKETNKIFFAPAFMVTDEWMKNTGFVPQPAPETEAEPQLKPVSHETVAKKKTTTKTKK